jgi:autotransporter passenger strand-loop-strand repeat protein
MPALAGGVLTLDDAGSNAEMTFATPLSGDLLVTDGGGNTTLAMLAVTSGVTLAAGVDEIVLAGGTASKLTVDLGSELTVADGGKLTSVAVQGVVSVLSGGTATDVSVAKGGDLAVTGGKADDITIAAGGAAYFTGGVASNTTLTGGLIELLDDAKLSGTFGFKGSGGVLLIEQTQLPTLVISGFAAGDAIYLADAAASGKVKVTANGELTISAGGKSYKLDIAGAKKGSHDFVFANHTLTEKSTKMAFARPVASAAPPAAALPQLTTAGGFQATQAPIYGPVSASSASPGWLACEPLRVPNGGIETLVTLQP